MAPKTPSLAAGLLSILGLIGSATPCVAAPRDEVPAPSAEAAAAPSGPPTVLLLTNGKVLYGEIRKDDAGYFLKRSFGTVLHPRRNVVATFHSLREVYEYKKARRPENDPDERMRLASWCLEQKMRPEAKIELAALLAIEPENDRVRAMIANIDRAEVSRSPEIDVGVVRTGGEVDTPPPAELNLLRLRDEYARHPRPVGLPAIFDLEPPLAVRRYGEFSQSVHPMLQRRCAKCHNEETPGEFQLIRTRAQRDFSNDLIRRANLEATLRIVDRDDLARSPILVASGMTHGAGGRPVLGGPSGPEYRLLAAWVTSLKAASDSPESARQSPAMGSSGESFASGRLDARRDPAMPPARPPHLGSIPGMVSPEQVGGASHSVLDESGREIPVSPSPAGQLIPGSEVGLPNTPPPPSAFLPPDPLAGTGEPRPMPTTPPTAGSVEALPAPEAARPGQKVRMPDGTIGIKLPDGKVVPYVDLKTLPPPSADPSKADRKLNTKAIDSYLKARTRK